MSVVGDVLTVMACVVGVLLCLLCLVLGGAPGPRGYSPSGTVDLDNLPQPQRGPAPGGGPIPGRKP